MANSDNVLRGGLTSKHIDARALIDVADTQVLDAPAALLSWSPAASSPTGLPSRSSR